jgi:protein TonB
MLDANFQIENRKEEQKNKTKGFVATAAFHALLLLLLYFYVITPPNPPFEDNDGGMAINFGTSDVGEGDVQPMNYTPVQTETEVTENASSKPVVSEESVVTQNEEEAIAMNDKKVKEKTVIKPKPDENALFKPSKNPTPTNTEKPKVDDNSLFKPGAYGTPNNSKGDGEGGGKGDQGDPSGDPNSKSYKGSGTGTGTGTGSGNGSGNVNLSGRSVLSRHVPKNPCEQTRGKVMVAIRVNRQGQVTSANYAQGGSTTADDCLVNVALQAARKYTFDVKSDAAEIQNGTILFMFKEN